MYIEEFDETSLVTSILGILMIELRWLYPVPIAGKLEENEEVTVEVVLVVVEEKDKVF